MPDLIILIPGTFSKANADGGWHQNTSEFAAYLNDTLRGVAECLEPGKYPTFEWSHDPANPSGNSEFEREEGGRKLVKYLELFENDDQPYHIIAHSHAGNVVVQALKQVALRKNVKPFRYLRSWTSVGTPFLRSVPDDSVANIVWIGALIYAILASFSFGWAGEKHPWFLLWMVPLAIVGGIPFVLWFVSQSQKDSEYEALQEKLWLRLHGLENWLGVYSEKDEAITLLKDAIQRRVIRQVFTPRREGPGWLAEVGVTNPRMRSAASLLKKVYLLFCNVFVRVANVLAASKMTGFLLGNDRIGWTIVEVSTGPNQEIAHEALPDAVSKELQEKANRHAGKAVAELREILLKKPGSEILWEAMTGNLDRLFTGKELIHTSYFDNKFVREVICLHIKRFASPAPGSEEAVTRKEWYQHRLHIIGSHDMPHPARSPMENHVQVGPGQ
jgi:hypothetical protein